MAVGDIGTILDTLEFDTGQGSSPSPIHISGDVYAIAYTGPGGDGWLCTITIDSAGNISDAIIDSFEFDESRCGQAKIIHMSGAIYAIFYTNTTFPTYNGRVVTVEISTSGVITQAIIDGYQYASVGRSNDAIKISGTVAAVIYGVSGWLKTLTINSDGTIDANPDIDTLQFDSGGWPGRIIHISGDIYAIAYGDWQSGPVTTPNTAPTVVTVDIDSAGNIGAAIIDTLELEAVSVNLALPSIVLVSGDVYAVAWNGEGAANDGWLATFTIDSNGNIGDSVIESFEYDTTRGYNPHIIKVSANIFAIAYCAVGAEGFIKTLTISDAGDIGAEIDALEFNTSIGKNPRIVLIPDSDGIVAIFYTGVGNDGFVITVGSARFIPKIMIF